MLQALSRSHRKVVKMYDVDKLCGRETKQEIQVKIGGNVEHVLEHGAVTMEEHWVVIKEIIKSKSQNH